MNQMTIGEQLSRNQVSDMTLAVRSELHSHLIRHEQITSIDCLIKAGEALQYALAEGMRRGNTAEAISREARNVEYWLGCAAQKSEAARSKGLIPMSTLVYELGCDE